MRDLLPLLPASLAHYAQTPEFRFEGFFDATVCAWRESGAAEWRCGPVEFAPGETDGAEGLFGLLVDGGPEAYAGFAEDYFECAVDRGAVAAVLAGAPPTRRTVESLSADADFEAVAARARAMGFGEPTGPGA
ncbi:hypothetical protein [Kitasatospora purpeofusca]|uniref:Uncharacterized protein n=1 Tax=Kitasatospora purpeofusca TaxID=67352 RepID=A0ABZ1U9E1_9ACTN|nr:hypothetical protein [Kitasatospora purpeofusca]